MTPQNKILLPNIRPNEARLFELVEDDDVKGAEKFLDDHPSLNVNATNHEGISAMHIAVRNRSEAMVNVLLKQAHIDTGDAVLFAIRHNCIKLLVPLLNAQKRISPGLEFVGSTHSVEFTENMTPLILAAELENYEIVKLLIARGHTIKPPHPPQCRCMQCKKRVIYEDPLYTSQKRLAIYRTISSPVYLVHVTGDPILAAFHLAQELQENAQNYRQLATTYLQLRDKVSSFASQLLGLCRTSEEVEIILRQPGGIRGQRQFVLPRLLMAVNYKQKEFVAHANAQLVLESYWIGEWDGWKHMGFWRKIRIILTRVFIIPVILMMCVVAPRHRLVSHWQIPLNKLITHATAYLVFLALLFHISNQDKAKQKRGPPNTGAEGPVMLYVFGYTWSAIRMIIMLGYRKFFCEMWNWIEIIMLILFGITFAFWYLAAIEVEKHDGKNLERKYWYQYDPTLLAEGTFCLATIFAFFRLMVFCRLNYHLGPLQVSLGKMIIDIYKYLIVFSMILSAFAAGLSRFYQYYDGMVFEDEYGMKTVQVSSFTSLTDTLNTLFWGIFCMAPLESVDVVIENTRKKGREATQKRVENHHTFTERIGYFCFGCFEVISVIVVLNMLIATMSNTFQKITDNVAIEWTFGKTEMYIDYMMQTTLPSPFNLVPTSSSMASAFDWIHAKINKPKGTHARFSLEYCCYIEHDLESSTTPDDFPALMSVLIQRYFRLRAIEEEYKYNDYDVKAICRDMARLKLLMEKTNRKIEKIEESLKAKTFNDKPEKVNEDIENATDRNDLKEPPTGGSV